MFVEWIVYSAITLIAYAFYKWATVNNDYFKRRGIKAKKPLFLLGNTGGVFLTRTTAVEFAKKVYYEFPDEP